LGILKDLTKVGGMDMNKNSILFGTIVILLLFVAIMVSGSFLKNPITGNDRVIEKVEKIESFTKEKNWIQAKNQLQEGIQAWEKVKNRIQFSVERDFLLEIDNKFATLKGAIKAKDEKVVITTGEELKFVWKELGK